MSDKLFDALEECLTALEQGQDLNAVLSRFPDLESDLRPVLDVAEVVRETASFDLPNDAMQRSRSRLLGHAAQLRRKRPTRSWFGLLRSAAALLAGLFVFIIGSGSLVSASAQALPGDPLYSVKRVAETVSLSLTANEQTKRSMKSEYNQRRKDETRALLKMDRPESVTFEGTVQEINTDFWIVDEIKVLVTQRTKVDGEIEPAMGVEVAGMVQPGGWVDALAIHLRTYHLSGVLQSMEDDSWVVDGTGFRVDEFTILEDEFYVGDAVIVLLRVDDNGEGTALEIRGGDESIDRSEEKSSSESEPQESSAEEDADESDDSNDDADDSNPPAPEGTDTPDDAPAQDDADDSEDDSEQDEDDDSEDDSEHDETPEPEETDESDA